MSDTGDTGDPETLTMLEARLAAALDKIAQGLAARQDTGDQIDDPEMTSAALEDAQARAEGAEARVSELEARIATLEDQLAETQASLTEAETGADGDGDADALAEKLKSLEAARQADRDEYNRTLAARDTALATLKADLEAAKKSAAAQPAGEDLETLRNRVKRLRQQRAAARAERDEALDLVEELQDDGADPDARLAAMRAELAQLRTANADLLETIENLRTAAAPDIADMDQAMIDEIAALRAARAAEAAELERIMADLGAPAGPSGKEKTDA